jgi:hypothetical protein
MRIEQIQPSNQDQQFAEIVGVDSAGAGSWKAPSCDTDGSAVSAWPVVGPGAPLDWDTYPTAGVGQKLSWGFGGEASEFSARCAADLSSLDSLTNNRNKISEPDYYVRPNGRGTYCGRMSISGFDPNTGRKIYRRVNCNTWSCSYCGPRKARTAKAAIRATAESLGLKYFLTLTLDPKKLGGGLKFAVPYMRAVFNKFRLYLKRMYGQAPSYICVLEFTKAGLPHLHVLFDRYISQRWISHTWDTLGGGRICFIKQVTVKNVTRYLSKYLTKDLLLSAPKGARRITTSRSIKLFPKFSSGVVWEFLRESIWSLLSAHRVAGYGVSTTGQGGARHLPNGMASDLFKFVVVGFDEENFTRVFEVFEPLGQPKHEKKIHEKY